MIAPRRAPRPSGSAANAGGGDPAKGAAPLSLQSAPLEGTSIAYAMFNRIPPPIATKQGEDVANDQPIRVGFIVFTFSFGGSETETIELVYGADPAILTFTGIAVARPLPLPEGEPPRDGSFPPIYMPANRYVGGSDPRVRITGDFREAASIVTANADIIISWGVPDLAKYLPIGRRPKLVVHSKDSGEWARNFLAPNSLLTRHYVGNSTLAARAFPDPIHERVEVIHDGINPRRVAPKMSRFEQRELWGLTLEDKVVGYLGRIERNKGVGKTVAGLAKLPVDWKVVFIGVNPTSLYAEELLWYCEATIPERYRLIGWCHDIGSALAALDVFCHPSDHEGFSNSLGEAWLAGVPTVYTRETGAIPDLGDLGIPVSADADGPEIADAILRAFRNEGIVEHARDIIRRNYLNEHYVRRWSEYLLTIYRQPPRTRVLLFIETNPKSHLTRWISALRHDQEILDLCCVAIPCAAGSPLPSSERAIFDAHNCPTFYVSGAHDLRQVAIYTRPDVILTFPALASEHLLAARLCYPVLIASPGSDGDSNSWVPWLQHLSR
jgi:glycosyltransferase involved in cell wall biosynthesis